MQTRELLDEFTAACIFHPGNDNLDLDVLIAAGNALAAQAGDRAPLEVPGGTLTVRCEPSSVGTSMRAPSTASLSA